jgi:hypothetical protein
MWAVTTLVTFPLRMKRRPIPKFALCPMYGEVVVCVTTVISIEWEKENIIAFLFTLLQEQEDDNDRSYLVLARTIQQ